MAELIARAPTPTPSTAPSTAVAVSRALALASVVSLIMLGLAWELWLAPTGRGWLALKVAPLLAPLPGLWRYRLYTYRWVSLLVWLYFIEAAVRAASDTGLGARLATIELVLTLALFAACLIQVRARLRGGAS